MATKRKKTTAEMVQPNEAQRAAARKLAAEAIVDPRTALKAVQHGATSIRVLSVRDRVVAAAKALRIKLP
jgi:hypothetical protein